jgi:ribosomal protein L11 methyltransferase
VIRLAVRVRPEQAEAALAELLELAPAGVEERDLGDRVEYAIYGPPGEVPELPDLEAAVGGALVEVSAEEVPDDWADRWRAFHRPLVLGDRLVVRPPWEPAPGGAALDVVVDPGRAFGTGAHQTTRLCLELLLDEAAPRGPLLDLGCGSGVLAIAAAKLGYAPVLATDFDPLAVDATVENARVNGVEVDVARADLRTDGLPAAPVVLANLLRPLLLVYAERLAGGELPVPERLIVSGLLAGEEDEVAGALRRCGLVERSRQTAGEWVAVRLTV